MCFPMSISHFTSYTSVSSTKLPGGPIKMMELYSVTLFSIFDGWQLLSPSSPTSPSVPHLDKVMRKCRCSPLWPWCWPQAPLPQLHLLPKVRKQASDLSLPSHGSFEPVWEPAPFSPEILIMWKINFFLSSWRNVQSPALTSKLNLGYRWESILSLWGDHKRNNLTIWYLQSQERAVNYTITWDSLAVTINQS